jgi:hypothetical protein
MIALAVLAIWIGIGALVTDRASQRHGALTALVIGAIWPLSTAAILWDRRP